MGQGLSVDIAEWVAEGIRQGWCSEPVCGTHDGTPLRPDEETAFDDGDDPCVAIVRLWND